MEGRVKHSHLGHIGQHLLDGLDAHHVHRVVQRSDGIALLDDGLDFVVDAYALAETLAAMHHAVSHGINLVKALDAAIIGVGQHIQNGLDGTGVVSDVQVNHLLAAVIKLQLDECSGQTNLLNAALGQRLVGLDLNQFVFHRTAAAVQYQYVHCCFDFIF